MSNIDFIYKRHSVRKFKDQEIPMEDIKRIIEAATYAPSGKNSQNWHFVIIKNKQKALELSKIIEEKNAEIASFVEDEKIKHSLTKYLKYMTLFKNAPVTILVYASPYEPTGYRALKAIKASQDELDSVLRPAPGIQNIGAAIENLALAAANLGYGTCWMTSPNYAAKEISDYIGFTKEEYFLTAIVPLGIPAGELKSPPRKTVDEVMTIVE